MRHSLKSLPIITGLATCVAALLLGAGCASSGYDQANKTAANIQTAANNIGNLPGLIDNTLTNLSDLVNRPASDLRPQYKQYIASLSKVESAAKEIADAQTKMGEQSKAYFAAWDAELAQITNEDIKSRSEARRNDVAAKFASLRQSYTEAANAYKPFMTDLKDIQKYLSVDLTTGGLSAIKTTVADANAHAVPLNAAIKNLAGQFKALGLSMSSVTPQPAK